MINGKWYIGKHTTDNIEDGYLGSGSHLKSAIRKYGKENFQREIICFCNSEEEAYIKEAELVTMEVVKNPMTYNRMPGGEGGQKRYTDEELKEHIRERHREYYQANREKHREWCRKWYQANRQHKCEYQREHYEANREQMLEKQREYYKANREHKREYQREYYEAKRKRKKIAKN